MEYLRTRFQGLDIAIRDVEESDVPVLVEYWHGSGPEYLRSIGVDVAKLTTPEETRQRFLAMLAEVGAAQRRRAILIVAAGQTPVAYSNVNIRSPGEAYAHAHVLDPALRGQGFASVLFASVLRIFFDQLGLETLIFQTSPENVAINRLIQRFGLQPQRLVLAQPDGMARPGEFNVYRIPRQLLARIGGEGGGSRGA